MRVVDRVKCLWYARSNSLPGTMTVIGVLRVWQYNEGNEKMC